MEKKKNHFWFWLVNGLIALVVLLFVIQNWQPVKFNFLGLHIEDYGFLVFLVIFLVGFITGWLWSYFRRQSRKEQAHQDTEIHYVEE